MLAAWLRCLTVKHSPHTNSSLARGMISTTSSSSTIGPGCGRSADPPEWWRFSDYADCLAGVISALGLVDPIIGGLSWSGTLAIEYLHRRPEGASALVLAGAYAGWAGSLAPLVRDERLASCLARLG